MPRPKDYTNQKFYRLTFIRSTNKRNSANSFIWEAKCECGETTYKIPADVKRGQVKSCGCLHHEGNRQYDPMITSARAVWRKCYARFDDTCDFETFFKLSQQNCFYCNRPPHRPHNVRYKTRSKFQEQAGVFTYNGLDRVDNSKTHTPDNVVPCCWDCNKAKHALSLDQFLELVKNIYFNRIDGSREEI